MLNHASGRIQRLRLEQQIGFNVGAKAIAVAQLVQRFDRDQAAFAARHPMQLGLGANFVVLGKIGRITQQQAGKAVAAPAFDQHGLALGNQALHVIVVTQVFTRLAVQDLQALALSGAVQNVHQARGLDHFALLIHEDARIVLLARGLLDARQQLDDVIRGRGRIGGARRLMGRQKSGQKRSGKPSGAMCVPGGCARPTCR
ncbi:hypothetical protein D3C71_1501010 [compost metagenome]